MKRPRIGVFKFTSCDGCQLSVLNLEEELLDLVGLFQVAYFREATDKPLRGHFDIALVEGSISTERQKDQVIDVRERTRCLVTIGACATSGGLQALRNWANIEDYKQSVYPKPATIEALPCSTPISDHVHVDYELWGCPVNGDELSETLTSGRSGIVYRAWAITNKTMSTNEPTPAATMRSGSDASPPGVMTRTGVIC
jgi:coenzyme F420-reducing hydrogenase gamma subunit